MQGFIIERQTGWSPWSHGKWNPVMITLDPMLGVKLVKSYGKNADGTPRGRAICLPVAR